jgi:hypothetical protein
MYRKIFYIGLRPTPSRPSAFSGFVMLNVSASLPYVFTTPSLVPALQQYQQLLAMQQHLAKLYLLVDAMLPDLLLSTCRVSACTKNGLHLLDTGEQDLPGDEPPDTLVARWACQRSLVCPELVEVLHTLQCAGEVYSGRLEDIHGIEANHLRQLAEEWAIEVTRVETNGHDSGFMPFGVDVDEMEFSFTAVPTDGVIGRCVDVPTLEVDGLVVVREAWMAGPIAIVIDSKCGSVAPV